MSDTPSTSWATWAWQAYREGRLVEADTVQAQIDAAVAAAFDRAAVIAFDLEDESHPRPWENWGEHRNMVTAQTVAKEIAEALRAEAADIRKGDQP